MAVYTITLLELASSLTYGKIEERENALKNWLFNEETGLLNELKEEFYPLFIKHYFFSEIGLETPELFRYRLIVFLRERSNYYNKLYELNKILIKWDLMEDDIEITEKGIKKRLEKINNLNELEKINSNIEDIRSRDEITDNIHEQSEKNASGDSNRSERGLNENREEETEENTANGFESIQKNVASKENAGNSNFPQAKINGNLDYWSEGMESNNIEAQKTENESNSSNRRANDVNITQNFNNNIENNFTEINNAEQTRSENKSIENEQNKISEMKELLRDLIDTIRREDEGNNVSTKGRRMRRQVPELVKMIAEGYIDVPRLIIKDVSQFFMLIW